MADKGQRDAGTKRRIRWTVAILAVIALLVYAWTLFDHIAR